IVNLHPNPPPPPRPGLPDPAHAENTEDFARTVPSQQPRTRTHLRPRARAHKLLRLISTPRSPQQQQHRHVRRRISQHAGSIRERNFSSGRCAHINVIVAHRKSRDHFHSRRNSPEKLRIQLYHGVEKNRIRPVRRAQQVFVSGWRVARSPPNREFAPNARLHILGKLPQHHQNCFAHVSPPFPRRHFSQAREFYPKFNERIASRKLQRYTPPRRNVGKQTAPPRIAVCPLSCCLRPDLGEGLCENHYYCSCCSWCVRACSPLQTQTHNQH